MTLFNILIADKSPTLVRARLIALCIVLLMAACALGEKAHAAVLDCGLKAPHHAASIQCPARSLRAGAHGTQASAQASASAANDSNGARLTPLSSAAAPAASAPRLAALLHAVHGPVRGPANALPLDRGSVTARVSDGRGSLGDVMQSASAPVFSADAASPLVGWSILLAGLFGLLVMTRGATVARAHSWATAFPVDSAPRSGTRTSALDRLDVARYAQPPVQSSRQGHFVRAAAATQFG